MSPFTAKTRDKNLSFVRDKVEHNNDDDDDDDDDDDNSKPC